MAAPLKTPMWAVRFDGSVIDAYSVSDSGAPVVVVQDATGRKQRWHREAYADKFAASPAEAVAKFVVMARRGVEEATEELRQAEAVLVRALALTPDEVTH